jgi:AraC-like DNA-binding protein
MFWGNTTKITKSNIIATHHHQMNELVVCLSDTGQHTIAGKNYKFSKGRTFFLPATVPHQAIGSTEMPAELAFICFDLHTDITNITPALRTMIVDIIKHKQYASLPCSNESANQNIKLARQIQQELDHHSPLSQTMAGTLLAQLLINHSRSFAVNNEIETSDYSAKLTSLCNWLNANPQAELSLDAAAEKTGMSRSLFARNFRRQTGMSLVEYILSVRTGQAIKLLTRTNQPIHAIATACGFSNLGYFYRVFKKHTNSTPRKLRLYVAETGNMPL